MKTTIDITSPVTLERHGAYSKYHLQMVRVRTFIEEQWEHIEKLFELPNKLTIRLRPLPNRSNRGTAGEDRVMLDVARPFRDIISTLMHELRHIEQKHTGRLTHKEEMGRKRLRWVAYWDGERFGPKHAAGRTQAQMDKYLNQPWEVDAREHQEPLLEELESIIGEKLDSELELYKK